MIHVEVTGFACWPQDTGAGSCAPVVKIDTLGAFCRNVHSMLRDAVCEAQKGHDSRMALRWILGNMLQYGLRGGR